MGSQKTTTLINSKPIRQFNTVKETKTRTTHDENEDIDLEEISKERKRNNRQNANRNDYGNEGFLLMMLYYLGCYITLLKPQKAGRNQKLKIVEIGYEENVLVSRKQVEEEVDKIEFPEGTNTKRAKTIITTTTISNMLLDILKKCFGFILTEDVKKKPEKDFVPERRILENIQLEKNWTKKEIVNEGVEFYENVKIYGKNTDFIYLKKEIIDEALYNGLVPQAAFDPSQTSTGSRISYVSSTDD
ncbi:hypothetical protein EIN_183840 [Entamoeba invadens IP1]|uniref:hypothetical protein n=1 Tax=Entamoeba invadens IP1 TaxID=370355 RepID=UPI0002C3F343|nr:hypothetical protein EIN_183840 [Entamoeba invadens IP1]ELP94067.1 hypothetical protein EIN_183840 [Entamoeba invadens IP1]|eukprot:XP_004260838.1 hypothetical protein EIN_183840 [Entamoeba invadens IP1]